MSIVNDDIAVTVWRGTNKAQGWELVRQSDSGIFDLSNSTVYLQVSVDGEVVIDLNSDDDAHLTVDTVNGKILWKPTVAESRLIPKGALSEYELELRPDAGGQLPICAGVLLGVGGLNADA